LVTAQSVEQQLTKLENDWVQAVINKDVALLDRVLSDDFTTSSNLDGSVATKAEAISVVKSGEEVMTSYSYADLKVRVYGHAAVVTGMQTFKQTFKGQDTSGTWRFSDTWVKRGKSWQCVVEQASKVFSP
jgi:ketosteroid isomerase-like protein